MRNVIATTTFRTAGVARILIVDDEPSMRTMLTAALSGEGYQVDCAASGVEALGHLGRETVDVVISDVMMPGMNGIELLKEIKRGAPEIEVILMTGCCSVQLIEEALRSGAMACLEKNSTGFVLKLLAEVEQALNHPNFLDGCRGLRCLQTQPPRHEPGRLLPE
ncbi:MAG: response regulator [Abditibacteriales bacterium]|nr:response regulator [Abditibacteriales bacterium]MDW8368460.1 response regulator [Abditibacteriales bacterium]